ncbi:hypothetical protein CR513_23134, partial [Mucuna pruriens]
MEIVLMKMKEYKTNILIEIPRLTSVHLGCRPLDDLRIRASNYIQMEEMTEFRDSICVEQSSTLRNHKDHGHPGQNDWEEG